MMAANITPLRWSASLLPLPLVPWARRGLVRGKRQRGTVIVTLWVGQKDNRLESDNYIISFCIAFCSVFNQSTCTGHRCPGSVRGLQGPLWGVTGAALYQTQPVSAGSNGPTSGYGWAPQTWWWRPRLGKAWGRKGKILPACEGESVRNSPERIKGRREGGKEVLQTPEQQSSAAYGKNPGWRRFALEDCSPRRGPTQEQRQYLTREKRNSHRLTTALHSPSSCATCKEGRGVRNEKVCLSLGKKSVGRKG